MLAAMPVTRVLPDDHRELEPPDPIPNSEVKRFIADGSVGFPHVRVGHRQASNKNPCTRCVQGFFTISTSYMFWLVQVRRLVRKWFQNNETNYTKLIDTAA